MKDRKFMKPVPPELSEEYDDYVNDAVALADGRLSPDRAAAVRARMEMDPMYRAVIEPIVDAWKAPPLGADEARRQLDEFWRRAGVAPAVEDQDLSAYRDRVKQRAQRNWKIIGKIAAVFAFLVILPTSYWVYLDLRYFAKVSTKPNVVSTVRLPDQSSVQLAPSSSVSYHKQMDARTRRWITLKGEGTFTVVPAAGVTFEVQTEVATVTVLGTRFTVRAVGRITTVHVEEGRVSVQRLRSTGDAAGAPMVLGPGARVRVTNRGIFPEPPTVPMPGAKP